MTLNIRGNIGYKKIIYIKGGVTIKQLNGDTIIITEDDINSDVDIVYNCDLYTDLTKKHISFIT